MPLRNTPIRRKLTWMILLTSGAVLALTTSTFTVYEFLTFRQTSLRQLATLGAIIAANSTAALAFDNPDDAHEILGALKAEPHVTSATLYDRQGQVVARYPDGGTVAARETAPGPDGYRFGWSRLTGIEPVVQGGHRLGTLALEADLGALYERLGLYGGIGVLVIATSLVMAYLISRRLQQQISHPIIALAETAKAVSDRQDYSVRATKVGEGELGVLTDAFNHMLGQIHGQNQKLHTQLARLDLLNRITRAIGERQDLPSIMQVLLRNLEENLPIDFGCVCMYDPLQNGLAVTAVGNGSRPLANALGMTEDTRLSIDENGLARSIQGHLVYEPDLTASHSALPKRLASGGLGSLVVAPLLLESQIFGVLIASRRASHAFSSPDCEFLRQLSEHVALAAHQSQIYTALQQAYDELRQSQQTVLQQERLRALGQMASGIAHDINNAISPVMLYTQSLLEDEADLSPRAREYLETIERAIDDVAATVSRMREFYRQRESQMNHAPAALNQLVQQVLDLTRPRWSDLPQQRGVVVRTQADLAPNLPPVLGAESDIREALTNLVFNAVDAMPEGGTLTVRTLATERPSVIGEATPVRHVHVEVTDTGLGMDEDTRRRCLEPFFTTKGERGTGLGLAMVYGMVQRHGAEIEVESAVGAGTTVRLTFAVREDTNERPGASISYGIPSRLRILVVDDDPLLLKSLRDTLENDGHVIVTANGGREGIDTFKGAAAAFSLVITDLGMPSVDGRQVAAAVKQTSPGTPVIMLTGWGQRMVAEGEVPANVDRLLSKPPKLRELREALTFCCHLSNQ